MKHTIAALLCAVLVAACVGPQHHADPPGPADQTSAENACANFRAIGCPEGYGSIGGVSCIAIILRSPRPLPLKCWIGAHNAAEAQGCGSLRCIR
jgi:hypothetical protein